MPLIEGYGLTEGGVVSLNPLDRPKPGSIGKPLPGVEVRLSAESEILVKSPCLFSGYLNDPVTTAEVLRDGWLHTGDIGHIDSDGYVFITGRKKELIVSSTGKKIYPWPRGEPVQDGAAGQPGAADRRPPALPDRALHHQHRRRRSAQGHGGVAGPHSRMNWCKRRPVLAEIQKAVARVNKQLAPFEQVRKYRVLGRDFSIERRRTDRHHEGAAHARHGELPRRYRRAVRGAGISSYFAWAASFSRLR